MTLEFSKMRLNLLEFTELNDMHDVMEAQNGEIINMLAKNQKDQKIMDKAIRLHKKKKLPKYSRCSDELNTI
jgi:hypothetical protein